MTAAKKPEADVAVDVGENHGDGVRVHIRIAKGKKWSHVSKHLVRVLKHYDGRGVA